MSRGTFISRGVHRDREKNKDTEQVTSPRPLHPRADSPVARNQHKHTRPTNEIPCTSRRKEKCKDRWPEMDPSGQLPTERKHHSHPVFLQNARLPPNREHPRSDKHLSLLVSVSVSFEPCTHPAGRPGSRTLACFLSVTLPEKHPRSGTTRPAPCLRHRDVSPCLAIAVEGNTAQVPAAIPHETRHAAATSATWVWACGKSQSGARLRDPVRGRATRRTHQPVREASSKFHSVFLVLSSATRDSRDRDRLHTMVIVGVDVFGKTRTKEGPGVLLGRVCQEGRERAAAVWGEERRRRRGQPPRPESIGGERGEGAINVGRTFVSSRQA